VTVSLDDALDRCFDVNPSTASDGVVVVDVPAAPTKAPGPAAATTATTTQGTPTTRSSSPSKSPMRTPLSVVVHTDADSSSSASAVSLPPMTPRTLKRRGSMVRQFLRSHAWNRAGSAIVVLLFLMHDKLSEVCEVECAAVPTTTSHCPHVLISAVDSRATILLCHP
jgi:hypothetical protein